MELDIQEVGLAPGYKVVEYPFIKEDVSLIGEDGPYEAKSWVPGVRFENISPEDVDAVADGVGHMMLTVVGVFKPGRYPTRVFFTRKFSDPDGNVFGKSKLHICTLEKFRRISKKYQHDYSLRDKED